MTFFGSVPIVKDDEGFYTYYRFVITDGALNGLTGKVDVGPQKKSRRYLP